MARHRNARLRSTPLRNPRLGTPYLTGSRRLSGSSSMFSPFSFRLFRDLRIAMIFQLHRLVHMQSEVVFVVARALTANAVAEV